MIPARGGGRHDRGRSRRVLVIRHLAVLNHDGSLRAPAEPSPRGRSALPTRLEHSSRCTSRYDSRCWRSSTGEGRPVHRLHRRHGGPPSPCSKPPHLIASIGSGERSPSLPRPSHTATRELVHPLRSLRRARAHGIGCRRARPWESSISSMSRGGLQLPREIRSISLDTTPARPPRSSGTPDRRSGGRDYRSVESDLSRRIARAIVHARGRAAQASGSLLRSSGDRPRRDSRGSSGRRGRSSPTTTRFGEPRIGASTIFRVVTIR